MLFTNAVFLLFFLRDRYSPVALMDLRRSKEFFESSAGNSVPHGRSRTPNILSGMRNVSSKGGRTRDGIDLASLVCEVRSRFSLDSGKGWQTVVACSY